MFRPFKRGRKPSETPSKRAKFIASMKEEIAAMPIDDGRKALINAYNHKAIFEVNALLAGVTLVHGFEIATRLIGAIKHVPEQYPKRNVYISNIVNAEEDVMQENEVNRLVGELEYFARKSSVKLDSNILWKCTMKHNEGYLVFRDPPVDECLNCGGPVYNLNRTAMTVFTTSGPIAGQKVSKRCKKECGSIFHLDHYSVPNKGKRFYSFDPKIVRVTNHVYVTSEVHELLCESRSCAYVSHHAFSEIYNAVFGSSANGIDYEKWMKFEQQNEKSEAATNIPLDVFEEKNANEEDITTLNIPLDDIEGENVEEEDIEEGLSGKPSETMKKPYLLTRKKAAIAYVNGQHIKGVLGRPEEAVYIAPGKKRNNLMNEIDEHRHQEQYKHETCPSKCEEKGN